MKDSEESEEEMSEMGRDSEIFFNPPIEYAGRRPTGIEEMQIGAKRPELAEVKKRTIKRREEEIAPKVNFYC